MADRRLIRRRGLRAAQSVVLGALVAVGINVLTGTWNWALAVAVGVVILAWATLEWRRAVADNEPMSEHDDDSSVGIRVSQNVDRVAGKLTGVGGASDVTEINVRQDVGEVDRGGEVIGYVDG
jgi:hypothetical protein